MHYCAGAPDGSKNVSSVLQAVKLEKASAMTDGCLLLKISRGREETQRAIFSHCMNSF